MVTIKSAATDEPSKKDYVFDEYRKVKEADEEYSEGTTNFWPWGKVIVFNQGSSLACTAFSDGHIYNGFNIIEDERLGENREQQNPNLFWDRYCVERDDFNVGSSIQAMALWFKNKLLIEGFVTIKNDDVQLVDKMKRALAAYFISTGSNNGDREETMKTGVYSIRTDGKIKGHAFAIVDFEDDFFWAIQSYGDKRGPFNGYFKIPFALVDKIYSKLVIIDKNDSKTFQSFQDRIRKEELISLAKILYANGTADVKKYFEGIQLSKNLDLLYK